MANLTCLFSMSCEFVFVFFVFCCCFFLCVCVHVCVKMFKKMELTFLLQVFMARAARGGSVSECSVGVFSIPR